MNKYVDMIPDGILNDALPCIMELWEPNWIAIIRSIDSSRGTNRLKECMEWSKLPHDLVNGNICLSLEQLKTAMADGLFTGFDEVWIINGPPPAFNLESLPMATSDGRDFSLDSPKDLILDFPKELSSTMEKIHCVLILGDGCGLNYAATSEPLRDALRGLRWC